MASRRLVLAALALVATAAAAGCLGGSGDAGGPASTPSEADPASAPGGSGAQGSSGAEANGTSRDGNATGSGNATAGWRNQTRTGGFAGARVLFGVFGRSEEFPVGDDAANLTLVIRAPDVELTGQISAPCNSGASDCPSTSYETASGRYELRVADPPAGEWSVSFFRGEGGAGHQEYVLGIYEQLEAPSS